MGAHLFHLSSWHPRDTNMDGNEWFLMIKGNVYIHLFTEDLQALSEVLLAVDSYYCMPLFKTITARKTLECV